MNWFFDSISQGTLNRWEEALGEWFFLFSLGFLGFELVRYFVRNKLNLTLLGDTATNFVTQGLFLLTSFFLISFYVSTLAVSEQFALFAIDNNWATLVICFVLADLMYYWEHRFSHGVALAWATHTVHHSSPHFNMSVAYRFGPMDAVWSVVFHVPLVVVGFDPFLVLFAAAAVLLYQTILHTEVIGRLPKPIEFLMNTPSHHRVHHGRNKRYHDKNFAGVFIVWDRMFGTFAEEIEEVEFGITEPINSVNPFVVFFHGFTRLGRALFNTSGFWNKLKTLLNPPGWRPQPAALPTVSPPGVSK